MGHDAAHARMQALQRQAGRYAWWLGRRSAVLRGAIDRSGWRLSRVAYRLAGKPSATLSWPLGLAYLLLNGQPARLAAQARWADHGLSAILAPGRLPQRLHIDMAGLGYAALALESAFNVQRGYLALARDMGERYLLRDGARNGLITYAEHRSEVLVDTLAMLCPFLARLSRLTGNPRYLEAALAQLDSFRQHATDAASGWVVHGFDATSGKPLGPAGWGRGVGWQLLGLTDTLLEIDTPSRREPLARACHDLLGRLSAAQRPDGHWPWLLTDPSQHADSSVTALVSYSLARLTHQDPAAFGAFQPLLARGRAALDRSTTPAGLVDDCSGEAGGVGAYSPHFGCYLWALAPAVAADAVLVSAAA